MLATVIDTHALLETVIAAAIAGLGVTAAFAFAILGVARFSEMRTAERPVAASIFGGLAALAFAGVVASIVYGIVVMTSK